MTRQELEQYPDLINEIEYLKKKIKKVEANHMDFLVGDTVKDYTINRTIIIRGIDWNAYDLKVASYIRKITARIDRAVSLRLAIEDFIGEIPDSCTRMIFEMRYLDNKQFHQIARELNMSGESTPRKRHNRYLDNYFQMSDHSDESMIR